GCGIGGFVSLLHGEGCDVIGTGIADNIIKHAKILSPKIQFYVYDVLKPFPISKSFDFVFAFEVLEHISVLNRAVLNIYKLLKKGGYFIGSTPYPFRKNMKDPTHINVHLPFFWRNLFISNTFSYVDIIPFSVPPFFWNISFNRYISYPFFVSATLIIAKK
ncbi:MAG: class I SAM-dependent methyltransferase, partial [Patescibacteria group bacterium]|nr:class I SAM-dependent methyltransferase [Patescibacteria group bacterium]